MNEALTVEQSEQLLRLLREQKAGLIADEGPDEGRMQGRSYADLVGEVHDRGEESSANSTAGVNAMVGDHRRAELAGIKAALQRMEDGSYGLCIDCGTPIGFERLLAWPMARRCIDCKKEFERQGGG